MNFLSKIKQLPLRSKFIAGYVNPKPIVSVITLEGTILSGRGGRFGGNKNINLESTRKMIDAAFKQKNLKLVCVNVNSPGGSAVQSDLVSQYIKGHTWNWISKFLIARSEFLSLPARAVEPPPKSLKPFRLRLFLKIQEPKLCRLWLPLPREGDINNFW